MYKKKLMITALIILCLIATLTSFVVAAPLIKLVVNGKEIKSDVSPEMVNGRVMVPVRWIAEALSANVTWDEENFTVKIDSITPSLTKEFVSDLIIAHGKENAGTYYFEGLSYEEVNLDTDKELEVVAKIDGAVHLGQFFIFDKDLNGEYQLILEENWKVEKWYLQDPDEVDGKKIFNLVSRAGGTGVDATTAHLWYIENGEFIEAWRGILKERIAFDGKYQLKVGSYLVNTENNRLYAWESSYTYLDDGITLLEKIKDSSNVYVFNGSNFSLDN